MATGNFVITQEQTPSGVKLTVQGRIDSVNAVELGQKLDQVIQSGKNNIVLNMHRVEYLCSTGIRAILKAYKDTKAAGGGLGIEMPSECVKNVLGMVALNEMLIQ
jgi:anti-anti-sigma factor